MTITTPIYDFVKGYAASGIARFHMPGHKGTGSLGCEVLDITEIRGADALYEADGIIGESERNASGLFGTAKTIYSTEGSSLCIRTMLHLALLYRLPGCSRTILAARNVHHAFLSAAALLDFPVEWLWPEDSDALCACRITADGLEQALAALPEPPAAVYLTSPDYLGNLSDISALASVCHSRGTRLIVDQAHGAYLRFLPENRHAISLGADLCCDSAHKTLPVLTGGAYLHFGPGCPEEMLQGAKRAMVLFGSTSPSYLILQSLDLCNRYLAEGYSERLADTIRRLSSVRTQLRENGWEVPETDPLRITVRAPAGSTGYALADRLRAAGAECEYADPEYLVLMLTPENTQEHLNRIPELFGRNTLPAAPATSLRVPHCQQGCTVREAALHPGRLCLSPEQAVGKLCGSAAVSCPPCIPICVSGEVISAEAAALMVRFGITQVEVLA